jgi:hypothetical protein
MTRPSKVDDPVACYPEQVRETASAARSFLKKALPDIAESVLQQPGLKALLAAALAAWKARNA